MELNDVALALFVEAMQKRTIGGTHSQRSVQVVAAEAFEQAKVFMVEVERHKPAPGHSSSGPLRI